MSRLGRAVAPLILGLLVANLGTQLARAEENDDKYSVENYQREEMNVTEKDLTSYDEDRNIGVDHEKENELAAKYGKGKVMIEVASIEPEGGPTTGDTRVLVRGGPFNDMRLIYHWPKCRFGRKDMVVDATYVPCATAPTNVLKREPRRQDKTDWCLQCDNSLPYDKAEIVPFTVSLTGDFLDAANSVPYRYYAPTKVYSIYPPYGPKDGDTFVQVWGENFLNFDENTRCNFGSKSVQAHYVNKGFLTCNSPFSDVVGKPIDFSISLNNQQNSNSIPFKFHNWPSVTELLPNYGPDSGGNIVWIKGNNFNPFNGTALDTKNDTYALFEGIGKVKGHVVGSTRMWVEAPPNYVLDATYVEITLNNQQYTDDRTPYYYYRPPKLYDVTPREGPTKGGTEVTVYGQDFKENKKIKCNFGSKSVPAQYISKNQLKCVSPPAEQAGPVPLSVSYEGEHETSETMPFLYYETPVVNSVEPACGPVTGYTQITVKGKNFYNMGFGRVKCVFNNTISMNATIMDEHTIKCDSPVLDSENAQGADSKAPYYYVYVTLNGGKELSEQLVKFTYYWESPVKSVWPNKGPLRGGTKSLVEGRGFKQEGACNVTVRYGAFQIKPEEGKFNDTHIPVKSPNATIPDSVVVSYSYNGQQFVSDKTLHYRDMENTFTYYQEMYVRDYTPKAGPSHGHTKIVVDGMGFMPFKNETGDNISEPLWVRFIDKESGEQIGEATEALDLTSSSFAWYNPPARPDTEAILQISFNKIEWQSVIQYGAQYSYLYYDSPSITGIEPKFGPVKNPLNESVDITGKNFKCPDPDCKDLYVRFGPVENGIKVKGERIDGNTIRCVIPKYTKPDVLQVEATFNDQDYTNDNKTYGFFDPFVLDVQPRLIHVKGTTRIRLYGFGFVNSTAEGELKTYFSTVDQGRLQCSSKKCIKYSPADVEFIDSKTIETSTFPQAVVFYQDSPNTNIQWQGLTAEAAVLREDFTQNDIEVFYYDDPKYGQPVDNSASRGMEKPLLVPTDFKWLDGHNNPDRLQKYGNFSCRWTGQDGTVKYTKAKMVAYPFTRSDDLPNHIKCNSPKWKRSEPLKLDISVNGQDYTGDLTVQMHDILDLYRTIPMCGPLEKGATKVKLLGTGFNFPMRNDVSFKWGVHDLEKVTKEDVLDYLWNEDDWIHKANGWVAEGSDAIVAYKKEAYNVEKYDFELKEGDHLKTYMGHAPALPHANDTNGGPVYINVGETLKFDEVNATATSANETVVQHSYHSYSYSFVEYYYYKQPVVKKVTPSQGVTRGGTRIEVSGAWFNYRPEYGQVPHCRIGDKVIRAQFWSTVRIVCVAPPNDDINQLFPLEVSLNGINFFDTGFKFHYFEQPKLYAMSPTFGPESGGTEIHISGSKFSNISDPQNFNCRFTSLDRPEYPPKYIPAFYENSTSIICSSPGGWGGRGDRVQVQVTFNGEDYSDNNFTFNFFSIQKAVPRSGPSDGTGGPILIQGSGFSNDTEVLCSLDHSFYEPLEVQANVIKCPMVKAKQGPDFFGNVDFAVHIGGLSHKFTGGFQYYPQIELVDMFPHTGPSEGRGVIHFYGAGFRDDFPLADVGCNVGGAIGKGKVVSEDEITCVVEEMPLVEEGSVLDATVALNSYSWPQPNGNTTYVPYGVQGVFPTMGPYAGGTDVLVTGKGFDVDAEKPLCRFGTDADFAIVEGQVLSYDKMICRSPGEFKLPSNADSLLTVPIGVAFNEQDFDPFTESLHRFRFYNPPNLVAVDPDEVDVGKIIEVYVYADENSEFFEPLPSSEGTASQYGIECNFGRFGNGQGMFVNRTTIKCITPSVQEDPEDIWKETVKLTVALNGQDFDEDNSDLDFSFVGTGSTLAFWPWVLGTLLVGLLLVALVVFCSALLNMVNVGNLAKRPVSRQRPHVIRDPYEQFSSRAYSRGFMGQRAGSAAQ